MRYWHRFAPSFLLALHHPTSPATAFRTINRTSSSFFLTQSCFKPRSWNNRITSNHGSCRCAMSDEVAKAIEAASATTSTNVARDTDPPTIFDKIISGEIPCDKVYEDDIALAFRDINAQAPVHILVIPKHRDGLTMLSKAVESHKSVLGHLMFVAGQVGKTECPNGFRLVINDGADGAQSVYHLHVHVLGGRQMQWPPG